eukprot:gnl/TRDRNA2_/TRDRNA2_39108_c0_seq1.p1 gnl/TRDRNA2_/TRDRNA2_39108_c0~~gnl/TRDRNA2_/TRDRNA2_39108_c0_seq1.p1  ORF type:complete len:619 (+),score=99.21 gnl/TRDRNA2_/TRDRNA2_39108_c0_seq1:155-2011(+)
MQLSLWLIVAFVELALSGVASECRSIDSAQGTCVAKYRDSDDSDSATLLSLSSHVASVRTAGLVDVRTSYPSAGAVKAPHEMVGQANATTRQELLDQTLQISRLHAKSVLQASNGTAISTLVRKKALENSALLETQLLPNISADILQLGQQFSLRKYQLFGKCNAGLHTALIHRQMLDQEHAAHVAAGQACLEKEAKLRLETASCRLKEAAKETEAEVKEGREDEEGSLVKPAACAAKEKEYRDAKAECTAVRLAIDDAACVHATAAREQCEAYDACRGTAMEMFREEYKHMSMSEGALKAEMLMGLEVQCLSQHLAREGALSGEDMNLKLKGCSSPKQSLVSPHAADSGELSVIHHDVPAPDECHMVAAYPCVGAYTASADGAATSPTACRKCPSMPQGDSLVEKRGGHLRGRFEILEGDVVKLDVEPSAACQALADSDSGHACRGAVEIAVQCSAAVNATLKAQVLEATHLAVELDTDIPSASWAKDQHDDGFWTMALSLTAGQHMLRLRGKDTYAVLRDVQLQPGACVLGREAEAWTSTAVAHGVSSMLESADKKLPPESRSLAKNSVELEEKVKHRAIFMMLLLAFFVGGPMIFMLFRDREQNLAESHLLVSHA